MSFSDNHRYRFLHRLNRLGYLIPATILCVFLAVALVSTLVANHTAISKARDQLIQRAMERLTFVQGAAEEFLEIGMRNRLQQLISSFAADADLNFILIVDREDRVLASDDLSYVGQRWDKLGVDLDLDLLERVRRFRDVRPGNNADQPFVDVYASLCGSVNTQQLRSTDCGFIVYRVDLKPHIQVTTQALRKQASLYILGMALVVLVTLSLLHFLIKCRTERITEDMRAFSDGYRETRIRIGRDDEIGELGRSVNRLLDKVVADEREIRGGHERLNALFDTVIDSVVVIDELGIIQNANPATEQIFGYRLDEVVGQNVKMLMPEPVRSQHDQYLQNYAQSGVKKIIGIGRQVEALHQSGRRFPVDLAVSEMEVHGRRLFTGIVRDISEQVAMRKEMERAYDELQKANAELERQATTDKLTGLSNRRFFDSACLLESRRASRQGTPLTLMMVDVDYFKKYNDHYGHPEGDRCLQSVAGVLNNASRRSGEVVARYGGEEFAVILPGRHADEAIQDAESLLQGIWNLAIPHAKSLVADRVTVSVGVCTFVPSAGSTVTPERLIAMTDQMLYQAKEQGRNGFRHIELADE